MLPRRSPCVSSLKSRMLASLPCQTLPDRSMEVCPISPIQGGDEKRQSPLPTSMSATARATTGHGCPATAGTQAKTSLKNARLPGGTHLGSGRHRNPPGGANGVLRRRKTKLSRISFPTPACSWNERHCRENSWKAYERNWRLHLSDAQRKARHRLNRRLADIEQPHLILIHEHFRQYAQSMQRHHKLSDEMCLCSRTPSGAASKKRQPGAWDRYPRRRREARPLA